MPRGGYQKPTNPAPASGPGKFARRTDGGPSQPQRVAPGGAYGERTEMQNIQSGAPMSAAPTMPAGGEPQVDPMASVTPFGAPSERPDEPVTHGNPLGAGAGPEALGLPTNNPELADWKAKYLPVIEHLAYSKESSDTIKNLYRFLRGQ